MEKNRDDYFEKKVVIVSFILSVLVVYIHANCLKEYGLQNSYNSIAYWVVEIISNGFGGIAVPLFFIISGFLFFRNIKFDSSVNEIVRDKQVKRIKSIVVPYLIWNTIGMIFYMTIPRIPLVSNLMNGSYVDINLSNILRGVFLHEYYFPFWYLKDLIIIVLLCGFITKLLANKKISALTICILGIFTICNVSILTVKVSSVYFYFFGAFCGKYLKGIFESKKRDRFIITAVILLIVFVIGKIQLKLYIISKVSYMILPVLLWIAIDTIVDKVSIKWFMKQSFFIYCSHIIIVSTVDKVLIKIGINSESWIILSFIIAPMITLGIIYIIAMILNNCSKSLYKLMCGNRG